MVRFGLRWRIEGYFRVLKPGCKIEELEDETDEQLQCAAAIAWRARLGRELPDLSPEIPFPDIELRVLAVFTKSRRKDAPKNIGEAISLVAALDGHFVRKHVGLGTDAVRLRPTCRNGSGTPG